MPEITSLLYKHDTDPESPNEAPEVYWQSNVAQLRVASECLKTDPELAKQVLKQVDDPAIRLLIHVRQLRQELSVGKPGFFLQCKVRRKDVSAESVCD
jgi:hypothetical protein